MIKVGIIGGAGYTAGELIRILVNHPEAEISFATSESHAGELFTSVHGGLYGDTEMRFVKDPDPENVDVIFLCMGHGKSREWLASHEVSGKVKVIDLSQDFRDESDGFVYGLPEIYREKIERACKVANPGCFATAIQLALLPMAGKEKGDIHVTALTGSTGAGVKPSATTHFSYRTDNMSTYKEFSHQHLIEVIMNLQRAGMQGNINFVPMRGDFARGIFVTAYFPVDMDEEKSVEIYKEYYKNDPFTHYVDSPLDLKQAVNTNKCLIHVEKHGRMLHVVSVIDNLLKGASGQAVENMNLMFGLPEKTGLSLKGSAF